MVGAYEAVDPLSPGPAPTGFCRTEATPEGRLAMRIAGEGIARKG